MGTERGGGKGGGGDEEHFCCGLCGEVSVSGDEGYGRGRSE